MYALIQNNQVVNILPQAPASWANYSQIDPNDSDTLQSLGWLPLAYSNTEPATDNYHVNTVNYSISATAVIGTYVSTEIPLAQAQTQKLKDIMLAFQSAFISGIITSVTVPGFQIYARRSGINNDLQDIQILIAMMQAGTIPAPFTWVGVNATQSLTLAQLQGIESELQAYGLSQYQRRFSAQAAVESATTTDQVIAVTY